jgi:predicted nucleic acid-binding protein
VIIDTSVWVHVERGRISPADVADLTGEEPVFVAPPVLAELQYGVDRARTAAQKNRRASAVARIRRKPCLIIDGETGIIFGMLAQELDRKGRTATHRAQDLWLAALAIQHNMKVLTENEKDFSDIPGLEVIALRVE